MRTFFQGWLQDTALVLLSLALLLLTVLLQSPSIASQMENGTFLVALLAFAPLFFGLKSLAGIQTDPSRNLSRRYSIAVGLAVTVGSLAVVAYATTL